MPSSVTRRQRARRERPPRANTRLSAICLFSSAGIGELGLEAAGLDILLASELVPYRVDLYKENFPGAEVVQGDIWETYPEVVERATELLAGDELFLLYATPPCQGMSTNGSGRLKWEIDSGRRDHEDPRNRLIIPTMEVARQLRPRFLLLENVPQMMNTVIRNEADEPESILDFVQRQLGSEYVGCGEVLACEEFGIAQRRRRLVSVFTRDPLASAYFVANGRSFIDDSMKSPGPTLAEAIGELPSLDAVRGRNECIDFHPQHRVPLMNPLKHWWVENTPEGSTAFNNQCVNAQCLSRETRGHVEELVDGRWVARKDTPIFCAECGELLPRPTVEEKDGTVRPLKGFHSAYRRMRWDQPARTITQNFIYEASDNKIHPSQHRVLSVYEAMILQTIDRYDFRFEVDGKDIGIPRIAEVIGESVAPLLIEIVVSKLVALARDTFAAPIERAWVQDPLLDPS